MIFPPIFLIFLCIPSFPLKSEAENILFYFGVTGFSHLNSAWPLVNALEGKGHNVTVISSYTLKPPNVNPNVTMIVPKALTTLQSVNWGQASDFINARMTNNHQAIEGIVFELGYTSCEIVLTANETRDAVYSTKFDLVIIDAVFNDCGNGIAFIKNAPFILYSACSFLPWFYDQHAIPLDAHFISDALSAYKYPMNFFQRLSSAYQASSWGYRRKNHFLPKIRQLFQKYFNKTASEMISLSELDKQTALVLLNTHPSVDYARSLPPLYVSVGGMHITDERSPLPQSINEFLTRENSKNGFIYVSFGTTVQISKIKSDVRNKIFWAMGNSSNLDFVWKWEGQFPDHVPENIHLETWMPQMDLFAHPNIKGAILHGGLNGLCEAAYHEIPIIVFPVCSDQDFNANIMESKGVAIVMEIRDFTQVDLEIAIKNVVENPVYKNNMKIISGQYKDRPMKPLETALWWTEYVLRHKNTSLLMPLSVHQTWIQYHLVDVWVFCFIVIIVTLIVLVTILYKVCIALVLKISMNVKKMKLN